jgi:hypothetical protein
MNAAFGAVSAGGAGTPMFDVTQSGGGPNALVANQPAGNIGGVTLSKFSFSTTGWEHPPPHKGVGVGVAPPAEFPTNSDTSSSPEADPARAIACEEPINTNAAAPAAIIKLMQKTFRNRLMVNERFGACIAAAGI